MSIPKIVTLGEINTITDDPDFDMKLIEAIGQGFIDFSAGKFNLCPIQTMGAPPMAPFVETENYAAQACVKSGYISGDSHFVLKVASSGHPLPNYGLMQVYSQKTGRLEALLLDEGILTELRTAAAGALAVKNLARHRDIQRVGVVGTGIQARFQLRYLQKVTSCRNLVLWGRTMEKVKALAEEVKDEWTATIAESPNDLLQSCNVVITATTARSAFLDGAPGPQPLLLVCIGADTIGKQELSVDLVAQADLLVCDSKLQTGERGEFQHALRESRIRMEDIREIGEVLGNKKEQHKFVIFDSSGVAIQDCVVAKMVYLSL